MAAMSHTIGYFMALVSWIFITIHLAYFWRFGIPHDMVFRAMEHGSLEQIAVIIWLMLISIFLYD